MGQVEQLKEAGSRALGLRVFLGNRTASTSTSDLSPEGIDHLVSGAIALAAVTSEDPFVGLPDAAAFGQLPGDLGLFYDDVYSLPPEDRIALARRCEEAALAVDTRFVNSDGGSFDASTGIRVLDKFPRLHRDLPPQLLRHLRRPHRPGHQRPNAARLLVLLRALALPT